MNALDSDLLRTFIAVAQAGSMTGGAACIHRSQSATSLQVKRLELILGQSVFDRHGRGVVLSDTGRRLLPVAQEVTSCLDAALRDFSKESVTGKLRIGIPDDHGKTKLAQIIACFIRQHPQVELDVNCALSAGFPEALEKGALDLAIYEVQVSGPNEELLFEDPTCWASSENTDFTESEILPVALFDQACWWRDAAIASLEARGKPYRIVYSSQSVSGVVAAVEAGIAIGLLGRSSIHSGLIIASKRLGFKTSATSKLVMAANGLPEDRPLLAMKAAIRAAFLTVT